MRRAGALLVAITLGGCVARPVPTTSPSAFSLLVPSGTVAPVATDRTPVATDAAPTPGPSDPLTDRESAIARAIAVAEIDGPLRVDRAIAGRYDALDPESRNAPGVGPVPSRWPDDTPVWRVDVTGPNGSESIVLSIGGDVIGWVIQGS